MKRESLNHLFKLKVGLFLMLLLACNSNEEAQNIASFESFDKQYVPYNLSIKLELEERIKQVKKSMKTTRQSSPKHEYQQRVLETLKHRREGGDYFAFKKMKDIELDLKWENGLSEPDIGDPRAKKGGVISTYINSFPSTLRPFGPNSNHSLRGKVYDEIQLGLVSVHPKTSKPIPALAKEWAVSKDGRTVYYRLDPDATYSDGSKVKAKDFMVAVWVRSSDYAKAPFYQNWFRKEISQISIYDEQTLSVTLSEAKVREFMPWKASLSPEPEAFYRQYGPDYVGRYQWKFVPTTGAYQIKQGDLVKGRSITQTRVKNWWAANKKYYRYRFNPDRIVYRVIREPSKAFSLFRIGEIDFFNLGSADYWYEKTEIPEVFNGYIEKATFYPNYPKIPRGIYLNVAKPKLANKQLRLGILHALNWQKVMDFIQRGDARRIQQFADGFDKFTDPNIKARPFDLSQAKSLFIQAGFSKLGEDGILRNSKGERLEISLSYTNHPKLNQVMALLKEEAVLAGLDLILEALEGTVFYKKVMQKQHELAYWGWGVSPPTPVFRQFFHSENAYDERKNLKAFTNNINSYVDSKMDFLADYVRDARTLEELRKWVLEAQYHIYEAAIYSPSYELEAFRLGFWRWVRWPDTAETRFCPPIVRSPYEAHVLWIDQAEKQKILENKKSGVVMKEEVKVYDAYRQK